MLNQGINICITHRVRNILRQKCRYSYHKHNNINNLECSSMLRVSTNVPMDQLIHPEACRHGDEEQRDLDGYREQQNHVVDAVDGTRRPNTLERLPSEGLRRWDK